jgi:hypothetical protein
MFNSHPQHPSPQVTGSRLRRKWWSNALGPVAGRNWGAGVRGALDLNDFTDPLQTVTTVSLLAPTSAMLGEKDLQISSIDVLGTLYFLGSNCHIMKANMDSRVAVIDETTAAV